MKSFYIHLLCAAGLLMSSCNDFLDVKPVGKLIPTEVTQFENLLNNTNTLNWHLFDNNRECGLAFFGDNLYISENQAEYLYLSTHPNLDRYAAYIFYEPFEDLTKTSYTWEWGVYRATGLFNNVIEGIEGLGMAEDEYAQSVIAQAKAGRAWSYLIGGLAHGPMYDPNGANTTPTIPYRTSSLPSDPNPALSTTAELFTLLKEDLDYAVTYAPEYASNPSRASKSAAYALRSMYHMYMRNWEAMYNDANSAWQEALNTNGGTPDNLLYDFNQFYYLPDESAIPQPGEDVEYYLELRSKDGDTDFDKSYSRENLFYRVAPAGTGIYPSADYLAIFDANSDLRYRLFLLNREGYSTTVGGVLYDDGIQRYNMRGSKTLNNQGITYPILLLMRAEAQARLGGSHLSGALSDLNLLRHYRYDNTSSTDLPNGSSLTQDELLEEILKERRRELPLSDFQRIFDLRRYVLDAGKPWCKTSITHTIGSKSYTSSVNMQSFQMQIKDTYIRYNPQWGLTEWSGVWDPKSAE